MKGQEMSEEGQVFQPVGKCKTAEEYESAVREGTEQVAGIVKARQICDSEILPRLYDLGKICIERIAKCDDMPSESAVRKFFKDVGYPEADSANSFLAVKLPEFWTREQILEMAKRAPTISAMREIVQVREAETRDKLVQEVSGPQRKSVREIRGVISEIAKTNPSAISENSLKRRAAVEKTKEKKAQQTAGARRSGGTPMAVCARIHSLTEELLELAATYTLMQDGVTGLSAEDAKATLEFVSELDTMFQQGAQTYDGLRKVNDKLTAALQKQAGIKQGAK